MGSQGLARGPLEETRFSRQFCTAWASQGPGLQCHSCSQRWLAEPSSSEESLPNPLSQKSSRIWVFCLEITELVFELCKDLFSASPVTSHIPVLLNDNSMPATAGWTLPGKSSPADLRLVCPTDLSVDIPRTTCSTQLLVELRKRPSHSLSMLTKLQPSTRWLMPEKWGCFCISLSTVLTNPLFTS